MYPMISGLMDRFHAFRDEHLSRLQRERDEADRLTLPERERSRIEALQFLGRREDGRASLDDLLDAMSAPRPLAIGHVARMIHEETLVSDPRLGSGRIPRRVTISLPPLTA